jgi:hypothetical protein
MIVKPNSEGRISREALKALKARRADIERANALRRSAAIANKRPGTGPRVAR